MATHQPITDIWFRTELTLTALAEGLGLEEVREGSDAAWTWVIGRLGEGKLDIARSKHEPPAETDTYLFQWPDRKPFSRAASFSLVSHLNDLGITKVFLGQWVPKSGGEVDKQIVHTCFAPHLD